MYTLYVIPGSHACRSAMLMLAHKRVPYRRVDIPTLLHPLAVKLVGFEPSGEKRVAGSQSTRSLRGGDKMGTVPALASGDERVTSNRRIARWLDERHPDPPLFPADPERRRAVEDVELWANHVLQMDARRVLAGSMLRDPAAFGRATADGRMGPLLYRRALSRRLIIPMIGRHVFAADEASARELRDGLPATLDRIDGWIEAGVIGGAEPNAADCMVAPSLALMLYDPELRPLFEDRPALALVDRFLPAP